MKYYSHLRFSFAVALALANVGCSKDTFLDVNTSPNNLTKVPLAVVLPNVEVVTGFNIGNDMNRVGSVLTQQFAGLGNQVQQADLYQLQASGFADGTWSNFYGAAIYNANDMINTAGAQGSPAYAGIGKLLKAYNFAAVTDVFGDVPYSQAGLGLGNTAPRFDPQQSIYKGNGSDIQSLFDLVREGLADLDKPSALKPSASDDIVYAGDLTKWKKMGNTLLLKLANTINKVDPTTSASVINEVLAKGPAAYITSNADDFQVTFGSGTGSQNPIFYFNYINRANDQMMSQHLLDSMAIRRDPRLPFFFTATPGNTSTTNPPTVVPGVGTFTGYLNGATTGVATQPNRSRAGVYQVGTSGEAPIRLITNFQRAFILAEAALTNPAIGNAQTFYQEGIRASMVKAGVADAAVTAYFAANPTVATLSTNAADQAKSLNKIITQKWIAWVGNGYEAYNDFRRTNYPRLTVVLNASGDDPTKIPVRFPYPNGELSSNAGNSPGLIKTNVRVWWDID